VVLASENVSNVTLARVPSIAVLPFDNMSGDPQQDFLSDGISETTISALSKSPGIFVIARNSSFTYKGTPVRVQQIAKDLGAQYVVEGSVQKAGDRVRITAQIIEAESGKHVWAERYDRTLDDVFVLQDEIAWEISTALRTEVTEGEQARVWANGTSNTGAWENSVKAYNAFMKMSKKDNFLARDLWMKSAELDPEFSTPWMGVGWTHFNDTSNGWSDDPMGSFAKAVECAEKAMALDDTIPDNYSLMGMLNLYQRKYDEAINYGEKAAKMNPNHATVIGLLGWIYSMVGRLEEAIALAERSMQLSPSYQDWVFGGIRPGTAAIRAL
jgi:adenylate cyclase